MVRRNLNIEELCNNGFVLGVEDIQKEVL